MAQTPPTSCLVPPTPPPPAWLSKPCGHLPKLLFQMSPPHPPKHMPPARIPGPAEGRVRARPRSWSRRSCPPWVLPGNSPKCSIFLVSHC